MQINNQDVYKKINNITIIIGNYNKVITKKDITSNFLSQNYVSNYDSALLILYSLALSVDDFENNSFDINILINGESNEIYKRANVTPLAEIEAILLPFSIPNNLPEKEAILLPFSTLNKKLQIYTQDVLEHIKTLQDKSINLIFCDPPYNLSSVWHFVAGRLCLKKGADFMGKWNGLGEDFLQPFFENAYRVLKYGGYMCMYNIDRQAFAFEHFALMAGFEICQTMYWANISNFPKASAADLAIDKYYGVSNKRNKIGEKKGDYESNNRVNDDGWQGKKNENGLLDITEPYSDLAKQFNGYKYGIAPLKKITEPLLIFRKAPKSGSVLHDIIAFENDNEISPAVLDIENARVGTEIISSGAGELGKSGIYGKMERNKEMNTVNSGRFPATLILTPETAELLDSQLDLINFELNGKLYQDVKRKEYEMMLHNAIANNELKTVKVLHVKREQLTSKASESNYELSNQNNATKNIKSGVHFSDVGGISKVMHHLDYTQDDLDSFLNSQCSYEFGVHEDTFYEPTVSPKERNAGCESFELRNKYDRNSVTKAFEGAGSKSGVQNNNHPTLKPIAVNQYFASLFKLPKGIQQTVYVPFSGSGSEIIGLLQAGYNPDDIIGCEINPEYLKIAKARIAYYQSLQPKPKENKTESKEKINPNTLF